MRFGKIDHRSLTVHRLEGPATSPHPACRPGARVDGVSITLTPPSPEDDQCPVCFPTTASGASPDGK